MKLVKTGADGHTHVLESNSSLSPSSEPAGEPPPPVGPTGAGLPRDRPVGSAAHRKRLFAGVNLYAETMSSRRRVIRAIAAGTASTAGCVSTMGGGADEDDSGADSLVLAPGGRYKTDSRGRRAGGSPVSRHRRGHFEHALLRAGRRDGIGPVGVVYSRCQRIRPQDRRAEAVRPHRPAAGGRGGRKPPRRPDSGRPRRRPLPGPRGGRHACNRGVNDGRLGQRRRAATGQSTMAAASGSSTPRSSALRSHRARPALTSVASGSGVRRRHREK